MKKIKTANVFTWMRWAVLIRNDQDFEFVAHTNNGRALFDTRRVAREFADHIRATYLVRVVKLELRELRAGRGKR